MIFRFSITPSCARQPIPERTSKKASATKSPFQPAMCRRDLLFTNVQAARVSRLLDRLSMRAFTNPKGRLEKRICQQHGPADAETQLGTGLAVRADARRIVVRSAGNQARPETFQKAVVARGRFISFSCHSFPTWRPTAKRRSRLEGGFWFATFGSCSYPAPFRDGAPERGEFDRPNPSTSDRRLPWRSARTETLRPCAR